MSLSFSKKSKCQGCKALCNIGTNYTCSLGIPISFETVDGKPWMPKPEAKCYKPKSAKELIEVRKTIKEKAKK